MKAFLLFCNIHCLTSQFVSGFIGTGYLLFGRNYLVIFFIVSVFYVFSIFYSIFSICIFVDFAVFSRSHFADFQCLTSGFLVPLSIFTLRSRRFSVFFVSFLASFHCRFSLFIFCPFCSVSRPVPFVILQFFQLKMPFIFKFSLNFCLFQLYVIVLNL